MKFVLIVCLLISGCCHKNKVAPSKVIEIPTVEIPKAELE